MLLAYEYRHDKDVILAYVNYNVRNDTHIDEKIVDEFAQKYQLKLEKLILSPNSFDKRTNFEKWARNVRYDFFLQLYQKYQCNQLLVAHHKDDFLETCLMQKDKNPDKLFYGIKEKIQLNNMNIYRPFLFKYWKNEIYELAHNLKIRYHDDYTNFESHYTRNNIRNNILNKYSQNEKEKLLNEFISYNANLEKKISDIKKEYQNWSHSKFDIKLFSTLDNQEEVIKLFINSNLDNINLNKNIIDNIIKFILANNNNKIFLLSNNNFIFKKNKKIYLYKKQ